MFLHLATAPLRGQTLPGRPGQKCSFTIFYLRAKDVGLPSKKTWANKTKAFLVVSGCVRDYPIDLVSFIRSARLQPLQVASFLGEEHLFDW